MNGGKGMLLAFCLANRRVRSQALEFTGKLVGFDDYVSQ